MAFVCWPSDGKDLSVTKVIALDGSRPPIQASYRKDYLGIDYSKPIPEDTQEPYPFWLSYYALFPLRWTADDKFLYLVRDSPADGVQYPQAFALMRLNIETGKVTPVLPPTGNYYFDFSADGTKLLSVDQSITPMVVKVANLITGDEVDIHLDKRFDQAGYLLLSPGGDKLVISTIDNEKGISMILADLSSMSQKYLVEDLHHDFFPMSWIDDRTIYGWSYENELTSYFYLDIMTKQANPAPTPTPISTPTP